MAKKIFMFRHQKGGTVTSHAFTSKPTAEQVAPLIAECERLHGKSGWGMVHELLLLDDSEIPDVPQPSSNARPDASTSNFVVRGTGTVTAAPK